MIALFWDIDGTLLTTGKAGVPAWEMAVREIVQRDFELASFRVAGLTDYQIAVRTFEMLDVDADESTIRRMVAAKQTMDSSTSTLSQRLVIAFHRRGRVAEHLAELRRAYAEKGIAARAALAASFAGTDVTWNDPDGGFYLWIATGVSCRELLGAAREEGVAFLPGDVFTTTGAFAEALRFSYSSPTPERIGEGVRRLRRAYDRVRDRD